MVAREGFVYKEKALSVTQNAVVWEGWSLVRVVVRQGFYCISRILNLINQILSVGDVEGCAEEDKEKKTEVDGQFDKHDLTE